MGASDFDKLNETNYAMWSYRMEMFLTKQELFDIVDGTTERPMGSDNSTAVKKWIKQNKQAKAEIVLRVEDSQLVHTKEEKASTIWTKLQNIHKARGLATRMALRRQFHALKKTDDTPMPRWITTVQERAQQLRELDAKLDDEEIISVLTSLPGAYDALVVNLDSTDPDARTIDYVITRLINEDARQGEKPKPKEEEEDEDLVAHQARGPPNRGKRTKMDRNNVTCFNCGGKGHFKNDCPSAPSDEKANFADDVNYDLSNVAY